MSECRYIVEVSKRCKFKKLAVCDDGVAAASAAKMCKTCKDVVNVIAEYGARELVVSLLTFL